MRAKLRAKPRLVAQQHLGRIELGHAVIGIGQQLTGALRPRAFSMNCSVAAAGAISSRPPKITCKGAASVAGSRNMLMRHGTSSSRVQAPWRRDSRRFHR
jgi:hypothetical protein